MYRKVDNMALQLAETVITNLDGKMITDNDPNRFPTREKCQLAEYMIEIAKKLKETIEWEHAEDPKGCSVTSVCGVLDMLCTFRLPLTPRAIASELKVSLMDLYTFLSHRPYNFVLGESGKIVRYYRDERANKNHPKYKEYVREQYKHNIFMSKVYDAGNVIGYYLADDEYGVNNDEKRAIAAEVGLCRKRFGIGCYGDGHYEEYDNACTSSEFEEIEKKFKEKGLYVSFI